MFKHRHLIVKRREHLTAAEKKDLATLLEYIPGLRLLSEQQSEAQAWRRW